MQETEQNDLDKLCPGRKHKNKQKLACGNKKKQPHIIVTIIRCLFFFFLLIHDSL